MAALFQPYPAASESIRVAARKGQNAATAIAGVETSFAERHRAAVDEAEGDLEDWLAEAPDIRTPARQLQRAAVWAAAQLERFADAIDDYNETGVVPRSISKLNAARAELEGMANIGQLVGYLKQEKAALDAELDGCAGRIAAALDREPTEEEIRAAWRAGNLPPRAVQLWPEAGLRLTDIPSDLHNTTINVESLSGMPDQDLADALKDVHLNPEIRQAILDSSPEAVRLLSEQWEFTEDTKALPGDTCNEGWIVGPDGRLYNIEVPGPGPESDGATATAGADLIPDDLNGAPRPGVEGWGTIDSREGSITYGDPVELRDRIAFVLGGVKTAGWQSIGDDQEAYVTMNDGHVYLNDGTQPDSEYGRPPDASPPPNSRDYYEPGAKVADITGMVVGVMEGLAEADAYEYNRHYATDVTFQEDATTGERRAVINIYQVEANDQGEVRVTQMNGVVDGYGDVVPAVVDENGVPVPVQ